MTSIRVLEMTHRQSAVVEDVVFQGPDGLEVEAYLVRPGSPSADATSRGPGLLMWHWLDTEAPDGNRTQYLDEAAELAAAGVVSLLPQGRFPWQIAPDNAVDDAAAVRAEVVRMRTGVDVLAARPDVDPARLGVVGHDFGGMIAAVAAADEDRLRALVIVAATPRWGDWFLPFWQIADDRIEYLRAMRPLDPIERISDAGPAAVLFQFAERDFYIAAMTAREFARAGPDGSAFEQYDSGHDMRLTGIRDARLRFLGRVLEVDLGADSKEDEPTGS